MEGQPHGKEAEASPQLPADATNASTAISNHFDVADIHGLLVDIKDVLGSFLQELKDMRQPQISKVSLPTKGKDPQIPNSFCRHLEPSRVNANEGEPTLAVSFIDLDPNAVKAVTPADMLSLREDFLRNSNDRFLDEPPPAKIYRTTLIKVLHESNKSNLPYLLKILFGRGRENFMLYLPDIITKELQSKAPTSEEDDGTTWELGGNGWRGLQLDQFSVTKDGRLFRLKDYTWHLGVRYKPGVRLKRLYRTPIDVWRLYFDDGTISFGRVSSIYGAISQSWVDPTITSRLFWEFAGPWEDWKPYIGTWFSSDMFAELVHYRLRMFAVCHKDVPNTQQPENSGLGLCRLKGEFPTYNIDSQASCQERRISLGYSVRGRRLEPNIVPRIKLVFLAELFISAYDYQEEKEDNSAPCWHWCYYLFYTHVLRSHSIWEQEWTKCLDKIDQCIKVKAEDVLNPDVIEDLMFDESFRRSKLYFTTLQLLRIFSDLIREMGDDLRGLSTHHFHEDYFLRRRELWGGTDDISDLATHWKSIVDLQKAAEKKLLDRIKFKTAEIESLRDGLFNATSVREASRSTSMNRAVIVFTIATVTYLPASFIATIFGTQLFNGQDVADTINKFKITTIVVSISTFAIAVLLVLLAANLHRVKRTSIYRKWHGKMQHFGRLNEKEEVTRREGEQNDGPLEQLPQSRLQSIRNKFHRKPKGNVNENA